MKRGPVVVRVVSCASVSFGTKRSTGIYETALTKPGPFGVPDMVLATECSDFDAERIADDLSWDAEQFGSVGSPESAVVIAVRRDAGRFLGKARLLEGTPAGEGMRTRPVIAATLRVRGRRLRAKAGHAPAPRAPRLREMWLRLVHRWAELLGADFNVRPDELARRYLRQVCGVRGQVLALLVPRRIPASHAEGVVVGSDHLAIDTVLWPEKKEHRHA